MDDTREKVDRLRRQYRRLAESRPAPLSPRAAAATIGPRSPGEDRADPAASHC